MCSDPRGVIPEPCVRDGPHVGGDFRYGTALPWKTGNGPGVGAMPVGLGDPNLAPTSAGMGSRSVDTGRIGDAFAH